MNLDFTPEEVAFREEVRAFIEEHHPKHLEGMGNREDMSPEDMTAWHKILGKKGWAAPAWPAEYGGTGWSATNICPAFSPAMCGGAKAIRSQARVLTLLRSR